MDRKTLTASLKAATVATAVTVLLIFGFNYIAYLQDNPDAFIGIFAVVALCAAGCTIGILCPRLCPDNNIICCAVSAFIYSALYTVVCILFGGRISVIIIRCLTVFVCAFVSCLLFKPRRQKPGKAVKQFRKTRKNRI